MALSDAKTDNKDIVSFLNIKAIETDKKIIDLEAQCNKLEKEKEDIIEQFKSDFEKLTSSSNLELEVQSVELSKLRSELASLNSFSEKKNLLEKQLGDSEKLLKTKEQEFAETLYVMEKQIALDKARIKREMIEKLNSVFCKYLIH